MAAAVHQAYLAINEMVGKLEADLAEAQKHKVEIQASRLRLSERMDEVLEQLAEAQKERDELKALFDMQWKRDIELITQWRKEGRVDPLTMPDYGRAQTWLLERAEAAEQQLAEVKAQLDTQAGVIRELSDALEKIANDEDSLACSDLPNCQGIGPFGHAEDCAVGIARLALAHVRGDAGEQG